MGLAIKVLLGVAIAFGLLWAWAYSRSRNGD
jgi:hypothetical protein